MNKKTFEDEGTITEIMETNTIESGGKTQLFAGMILKRHELPELYLVLWNQNIEIAKQIGEGADVAVKFGITSRKTKNGNWATNLYVYSINKV